MSAESASNPVEKPEKKRRRIQPTSEDEYESDGCESVSSDGSDSMGSLREFIVDSDSEGSESDAGSSSGCSDISDAEECDEDSGVQCPAWIDESNIVVGKRTRRSVTRYQDPQYRQLMMEDCDSDLGDGSSSEEEETDEEGSDASFEINDADSEESDSGGAETPTIEKKPDDAGQ